MMKQEQDNLDTDALRPRRGFLVGAVAASAGAVAAFLYRQDIVGLDGGGEVAFAFLLGMLILLAMLLLLCYRVPRIGNRLLGFDVVLTHDREKPKSSMHYTGSFHVETGLAEKRQNTRRKQARFSRRKFAEVTRQMQAEQAAKKEKAPENKGE